MIVLSIGMPRAGSGWYYNLTHDLITATGGQDARQIRRRYHLQSILTEVNCNIGALTTRRLLAVLVPSLLGNTFVIKAHAGPTPLALNLVRRGFIRPAYIYRDPRDAMLSAMDYGKRTREKGRSNAFSHLTDLDKAVAFMHDYLRIWEAWMQCPHALHTRYEDLRDDYKNETMRLVNFLNINANEQAVQEILAKYQPQQARAVQKGIHFNKGKSGRFRQRLSGQQQAMLLQEFGPYLTKMGYE